MKELGAESPPGAEGMSAPTAPAGPRIPEVPDPLDQRQAELFGRIAKGPRGGVRGPLGLWLHSPDVAEHAQALGEYLRYRSVFPPHLSELIIIVVARHFDCDYEWSVHAPIAGRAGIPAETLRAIAEGRPALFGDEDQSLVYRFVTALLEENDVEDATFGRFSARFGERGVVEATAIVGYYAMAAMVLNVVRMPVRGAGLPDAGGRGLR